MLTHKRLPSFHASETKEVSWELPPFSQIGIYPQRSRVEPIPIVNTGCELITATGFDDPFCVFRENAARQGPSSPSATGGEEEAQAEALGPAP